MASVITEPQRPAVPVAGTDRHLPGPPDLLRRAQLRGACARDGPRSDREPPFFFMKPADALQPVPAGETVDHPLPAEDRELSLEIELVVGPRQGRRDIPVEEALDHVFGYAVGLDMTRRDLQGEAKKLRRPWEMGKGSDFSGPVGPIHPAAQSAIPRRARSRSPSMGRRSSRATSPT